MQNVINKIQKQEQKPSIVANFAAPAFSDYNHENNVAFLFKVSNM